MIFKLLLGLSTCYVCLKYEIRLVLHGLKMWATDRHTDTHTQTTAADNMMAAPF